ncbi:hypothetical protein [Polyangium fumosum]|uniref:PEGA domain-containing protein n=1 Tax=Polyangium fumosum TaxID=889272 RepID=A0A4U1J8F3_9BACT|nr:hypothetical protein [Polyangium fumosum]TKD03507.1 hypothetical protein E8A74_25230 [Polyangium fumosum]
MSRALSAPRVLPAAFFALAALSAPPSHAAPPPDPARKAQCAAAFEEGQELEKAGRLVEARGKFVFCSAEACPAVVRDECATMLPRVESSLPTIVPGLRDAQGNDVVSAEVTLDGTVLTKTLDGQPIAVNPGPHTLRFVAPNAAPVERQVVVRVGEKNRVITVDLEAKGAAAPASPNGGPDEPAASGTSGKRVASYVLGGLGVVSLGAFAYLGITGKGDLAGLRDGCGRTQSCAEADVDAVKTKLLLADVSLGVGVVSLGVATALFFTSGSGEKKATAGRPAVIPVVAPLPGGGAAMLVGTF